MEKDKSRGLKHMKGKEKYRAKSTKKPMHVPPQKLPNLDSNWDRYEDEPEASIHSFKPTSSTDFSILSDAPISRGHHFQFKSDKVTVDESEPKIADDLFRLDLVQLRDSILTIPFHERIGIDESYFSESQILAMNSEAKQNLDKFHKTYNVDRELGTSNNINLSVSEDIPSELEIDSESNQISNNRIEQSAVSGDEEIAVDIDGITVGDFLKHADGYHGIENDENDLEQWLDDLLDK